METCFSINIAWPPEKKYSANYYWECFKTCKKYNIGCIRVFTVPWGLYPIERADDLKSLCEILSIANKLGLDIVLVLDTYVNYVKNSYRDFINSDYGWHTNHFSHCLSLEDFLISNGKTRYVEKISDVLHEIEKYGNVTKIELCNEIDQIDSKPKLIVRWINNSISELSKQYSDRFEFRVSISDYRAYDYFSKQVDCKCDIHTYRFPYNTALENYTYLKQAFPEAWISEFACFSDFAYAETIESRIYFSAMVLSASFEKCTEFPAPWWWEKILPDPLYMNIYVYLTTLDTELIKKEIDLFEFTEIGKHNKQDAKIKNKIKYRLSVLKTNPQYIKQELPAITKFLRKKLWSKFNHSFAVAGYETRSGDKYIVLETYVPIEVKPCADNDSLGSSRCIDVIRNQKTILINMNETITLNEGTYLFIIHNG